MTKINTFQKIIKKFLPAFTLLFLILASISLSAQTTPAIQKWYGEMGFGGTTNKGSLVSAGIQTVWKNNWITGFSFHSIEMESKNLPRDFDPGYTIIFFIPIPNPTPGVDMNIFSLEAGKYIKSGKNTWFTTTAGLSLVNANELNFSRRTSDPSWNGGLIGEKFSNYTYTEEKKSTIGALLKAEFNWAMTSFGGVGAGVFANFNQLQSPIGYNIKFVVGKMNKEKRNKS